MDENIKSYNLKKLNVTRNFTAYVIGDTLKYLVKDGEPVQGDYGDFYDYFDRNGFKIIGIHLKNKHIEMRIEEILGHLTNGLGLGLPHGRIQEEHLNRIQLARGNAWMSTSVVADRRLNFPAQMMKIRNKFDIASIQKACINAPSDWILIKRLALLHKDTNREILNLLMEVKKGDRVTEQELYTAYIERNDGKMVSIDRYNPNQLEFLWENNGSNIYEYRCNKRVSTNTITTFSCEKQF